MAAMPQYAVDHPWEDQEGKKGPRCLKPKTEEVHVRALSHGRLTSRQRFHARQRVFYDLCVGPNITNASQHGVMHQHRFKGQPERRQQEQEVTQQTHQGPAIAAHQHDQAQPIQDLTWASGPPRSHIKVNATDKHPDPAHAGDTVTHTPPVVRAAKDAATKVSTVAARSLRPAPTPCDAAQAR